MHISKGTKVTIWALGIAALSATSMLVWPGFGLLGGLGVAAGGVAATVAGIVAWFALETRGSSDGLLSFRGLVGLGLVFVFFAILTRGSRSSSDRSRGGGDTGPPDSWDPSENSQSDGDDGERLYTELLRDADQSAADDRIEEAEDLYLAAIRQCESYLYSPVPADPYEQLARALDAAGRTEDALAVLERYREFNSEFPEADWVGLDPLRRELSEDDFG